MDAAMLDSDRDAHTRAQVANLHTSIHPCMYIFKVQPLASVLLQTVIIIVIPEKEEGREKKNKQRQ